MGCRALLLALVLAVEVAAQGTQQREKPAGLERKPAQPLPTWRPADLRLGSIRLPPGFAIETYADGYIPARFLALGLVEGNTTIVYASTAEENAVFAIVDKHDGRPRQACVLLHNLPSMAQPNGIAYDRSTGSLYIAGVDFMTRHDNVDAAALAGCNGKLVNSSALAVLPPQNKHANRGLTLGPDGKLYYTVAAPFDLGLCTGPYCSIWRMDSDGSNRQRVVQNVRNAAGYSWHPGTGQLLFVGMERDGMGNEAPDDVLVAIPIDDAGIASGSITDLHWPVCHWQGLGPAALREPGPGQAISDSNVTWGSEGDINRTLTAEQQAAQAANCSGSAPRPLQALGPHVSPLGVLYWAAPTAGAGRAWPAEYDNSVFVAEHGSWNRTPSLGYRIVNLQLADDGRSVTDHAVFADGWLTPEDEHWGRPVGLLRLPDSSMLIGDDYGFTIYRVYPTGHTGDAAAPAPAPGAEATAAAAQGPAAAPSAAQRSRTAAVAAWLAAAAAVVLPF